MKIIRNPWFSIAGLFIAKAMDKLMFALFPLDVWMLYAGIVEILYWVLSAILIYAICWNITQAIKARRSSGEAEGLELERQREIEKKEIDMVRKSNEILLHLIQDEHREGDR